MKGTKKCNHNSAPFKASIAIFPKNRADNPLGLQNCLRSKSYVEYSGAAIANEKWPLQVTGYYHNVRGQHLSSGTKLLNFTAILKISFCHSTADFAFAADFAFVADFAFAADFAASDFEFLN